MKKLSLTEIATACNGTTNSQISITSISTDTRKIIKGCLFICLIGEKFDAHAFIDDAFSKGASAVMISRDIPLSKPYVKVEDATKALLMLAAYYRRQFSFPVVGITGSVGKTTTKEFTFLALSAKYNTIKTEGNLNNEIGMPSTILSIEENTEAAVIEMGMNHFGEISALSMAASPNIGVITNVGVSHIENLGSRDGILKAKLEILDGMTEGSPLIINKDNDKLATVKNDDYNIKTFSIDAPSDFRAIDICENGLQMEFNVAYDNKLQHIVLPTRGVHNVYNALAAFAVATTLKIDAQSVAKKFLEYRPIGMRQNIVNVGNITVIEDCYNASPDSTKAALKMLSEMNSNQTIAVLGDMLELGDYANEAHKEIGEIAAELNIDYVLTIGNYSTLTTSSAKTAGCKNAYHFESNEDLENFLFNIANDGDSVLFKASRRMKLEDVMNSIYIRWQER